MSHKLAGKRIAILVANGFEQIEMTSPREALQAEGAVTDLISLEDGQVQGMNHDQFGDKFDVDVPIKQAKPEDYDALVLPGGVANPDTLRVNENAVAFVKAIAMAGKPISAICHGPWTLIEAGLAKGRKMTSFPSLKTDLQNAGAMWEDSAVVTDRGLTTSRTPADLPAFNKKTIEEIVEGRHGRNLQDTHKAVEAGKA